MATVNSTYSPTNDRTDRIRFGSARGAMVGGALGGLTFAAGAIDTSGSGLFRIRTPNSTWAITAATLGLAGFAGVAVAHVANFQDQDTRHTAGVIAAAIPGAAGGAVLGSRQSLPLVGRIGGAVVGGLAGAAITGTAAFFGLPSVMAE